MASTFEWRAAGSYFKHSFFRRGEDDSSSSLRIFPSEMESTVLQPSRLDSGVSVGDKVARFPFSAEPPPQAVSERTTDLL
jgi:hypothetical protein